VPKKSEAAQMLANRPGHASTQFALAFDDASGSSVLRSAADRLPGFQPTPKKMGRPRGSKNRDQAKLLALVSQRAGTDPLLWMADFVRLTPGEAAKLLSCKVIEAAEFQRKCAVTVNEYARGKPAQRVELTGDDGVPLFAPMFYATQQQAEAAAGFGFGQGTVFTGETIEGDFEVTPPSVTLEGQDDASD
jgi:hypothetical protein